MLEEIRSKISELSASEFDELVMWMATTERTRRQAKPLVDAHTASIVQQLREKGLVGAPDLPEKPVTVHDFPEWVKPQDETSAYIEGDKIVYGVRVYEAVASLVLSEPAKGSQEWLDITDKLFPPVENEEKDAGGPDYGEGEIVPWEQGGNYGLDQLVSYEGKVYRLKVGVYGATTSPDQTSDYELVESVVESE